MRLLIILGRRIQPLQAGLEIRKVLGDLFLPPLYRFQNQTFADKKPVLV